MSLGDRFGPRASLCFEVVHTDHCSVGYFHVYFPVPLGSPYERPCVFTAGAEQQGIVVSLPKWRLCNEMRFVYYQWDPCHDCYTRQAQGLTTLDPEHVRLDRPQPFTVKLTHVGHYSRDPTQCRRVTLKLVDVKWTNVKAHEHTQAVGLLEHFGHGMKVSPFSVCTNQSALHEYLQRERERSHSILHRATGLPPWFIEGRPSIVGDLPLWAFALPYAQPVDRGAGVVAALGRMCRMALAMLGKRQEDLTHVDRVELMADVASLLPRCLPYVADRYLPCQPDKQSPRLLYEDVWCLLLSAVKWTDMGYDCEDGALLAYHVVRLLQTVPMDHGDKLLRQVQVAAHLYVPFVAVGTLNCMSLASTPERVVSIYHCYLMMVCRTAVEAKLKGRRLHPMHKHEKTLIIETTEWTTAHPDYMDANSTEYRCAAMVDPRCHLKVPRSVMEASAQYDVVLQLLCPHLFEDPYYKVPSIHCESADGEYGVKADILVNNFASNEWKATQWADVTDELYQLVRLFVAALPPCQSIAELVHGFLPDVPTTEPGSLVLYCRADDAKTMLPLLDRYLSDRDVSYTLQECVTFLRGLSMTLLHLNRADTAAHPGTRPPISLDSDSEEDSDDEYAYRRRPSELNRVFAQAHFPIRGRGVYYRTMQRVGGRHPEL